MAVVADASAAAPRASVKQTNQGQADQMRPAIGRGPPRPQVGGWVGGWAGGTTEFLGGQAGERVHQGLELAGGTAQGLNRARRHDRGHFLFG